MIRAQAVPSTLPDGLLAKATLLDKTPAWSARDAPSAINALRKAGLAVTGVELWRGDGDPPRRIVVSTYQCRREGSWSQYVDCCAGGALAFVFKFDRHPGALFSLAWSSEGENLDR